VAKDDKKKKKGTEHEDVVDLAARIGARSSSPEPAPPEASPTVEPPPPPPPPTRLDGPIPSAPKPRLVPAKEDRAQSAIIQKALVEESQKPEPAIPSPPRAAPGPGEVDLVVTPLPTPDDWHRFELALRKVRGVGQLRTEYYRHGVLKVRVSYQGSERLAAALRAGVPGYRVRVIGEDRATLQILVTSEGDERRPG
jgi:hypothetical protein